MPATDDDARLGPTAHYTAYVWRRAGLRYAEHFSTWQGAVLYWGFFALGEWATRLSPSVPSMREYLEYRHRMIDSVVFGLRPGFLVELGAGLTRRAVTWAVDHEVPCLELDLPAMARLKQQRLAEVPEPLRRPLESRHAVHEIDALAPEFSERLAAWLRGRDRPVVVAEGLLNYFDEASRRQILASIATALRTAGGGVLVCEVHTKAAQARVGRAMQVLRAVQRGLTRRRHASDAFADLDGVHEAFLAAGFDACRQEHAADHADTEPRLARLRSPVHVMVARVDAPA